MFRAEYVAQVDADKCTGCRRCMRQCLFGAMGFSLSQERCGVNEMACYGCGVCRAACEHQAISLKPREAVPMAANLWGI
jgi:heterodisulfide reductase subunit A-like polyferredoxin